MSQSLGALISGTLFGIGLVVSGMTQPAKVIGFLDFAGDWDPTLLVVLGVSVPVYFVGLRFAKKRRGERLQLPTRKDIDFPLVAGATLFGTGWGLAGYCPGPGMAAAGAGSAAAFTFVGAMLAGMALHHVAVVRRAFHSVFQPSSERA